MRRNGLGPNDAGFTLVELMTTLIIVGTLVLIAIPIYVSAKATAEQTTCFQNQNTLARATEVYLAVAPDYNRADLAGIVDADHPIVTAHIIGNPPRCPSGVDPVDKSRPTIPEGAYQFDAGGTLMGCTLGTLAPHGSVRD